MKQDTYSDLDRKRIRERWPQMRPAEKAGYILHYYGIAIAALILLLSAAVFLIRDIRTKETENGFYVMAIDVQADETSVKLLEEELLQVLKADSQKEHVLIETGYASAANFQNEATSSAYMRSGRVDLLIAPEEEFNRFAATGFLKDLTDTDLISGTEEARIFFAVPADYSAGPVNEISFDPHRASEESGAFGLYLNGGIFDGFVMGVLYNCPHPERIPAAFSWLGQEAI